MSIFMAICALVALHALSPQALADCNACSAGTITCNGSITASDQSSTSRLQTDLADDTCATPGACPGVSGSVGPFNYTIYRLTNTTGGASPDCFTVTLNNTACGIVLVAAAYSPAFIPTNVCTNFLAAPGTTTAAATSDTFSFNLANNATADIVVWNNLQGQTCTGNYTLTISPCPGTTPSVIKLDSFAATNYNGNVFLNWKTGFEVDNLGFNLYRDQGGKRTLITQQMVAGSALLAGPGITLGAGQSYSWFDSPSRSKDAQYWLEEIDLNGHSTWHGPVIATGSGNKNIAPPWHGRNTLLSMLGASGGQQASSSPVEARATFPEMTQSSMQVQSSLTSQKAVKLSVKQEGLYRVSQPDLVRAGLDANVDPRRLQLYAGGQQVPIAEVNTANGRFDSSSAIEFYGMGIDSAVTDSRTYWLVAGSEPGLRIGQATGKAKAGKSSAASFPYTVERKDRTIYFSGLRNGEKENFFGAVVARNPVDQTLSLKYLDTTASEAFFEVSLQGVSMVPHRVEARINGARAGEVSFDGQAGGVARFSIPQALLKEGVNTVTLTPQGEQSDVSLVNYIRVTYQRSFTADDDALKFTAAAGRSVTVDGFASAAIRVFDITDQYDVREVVGKVKKRAAGYSVSLSAPGNSQRTLLALTNDRAKSPYSVVASHGSNLQQEGPGADLLIITRRDFFDSLSPLVALRQSQGLSVALIDIEDIYDSFSFGQKTPQAMKDFLAYAKASYKTAPRYVLIAGDANLDSKNYLGLGDNDIVPTKLIDTQLMETASDDWFVEATDMAIGRLPVSTTEEASSLAAKIVSYDQSNPSQEVLLVSDINDDNDFEGASAQLRGFIPSRLRVEKIDRGKDGDSIARARLINALMRGQKIVNYVGHGSVDQWKANLLTGADVSELQGAGSLPVFVMMTCLNGYFQDISVDSLAETLVKAPRGAIAVWASSGMTSPDVQSPANQELYRLLFSKSDSSIRLGDAIRGAKSAASNEDVRRTWVLFGDPSMRIR